MNVLHANSYIFLLGCRPISVWIWNITTISNHFSDYFSQNVTNCNWVLISINLYPSEILHSAILTAGLLPKPPQALNYRFLPLRPSVSCFWVYLSFPPKLSFIKTTVPSIKFTLCSLCHPKRSHSMNIFVLILMY